MVSRISIKECDAFRDTPMLFVNISVCTLVPRLNMSCSQLIYSCEQFHKMVAIHHIEVLRPSSHFAGNGDGSQHEVPLRYRFSLGSAMQCSSHKTGSQFLETIERFIADLDLTVYYLPSYELQP